MGTQSSQFIDASDRRSHCRFPLAINVRVDIAATGSSMTVKNHDISWGGVRFIAPRKAIPESGFVTVTFPWAQGDQFSATAEIVRTEYFDERHDLIAGRFYSLSTSDQRHLDKLLQMLQETTEDGPERRMPLVPVLEVLFSDPDEIRAKLAELAEGRLSVTVFEQYEVNQSIRLVLGGIADHRALRLRARVADISALAGEIEPPWPMYEVELRFEHPLHELKAAAVVAFGMAWLMGSAPRPQGAEAVLGSLASTAPAAQG